MTYNNSIYIYIWPAYLQFIFSAMIGKKDHKNTITVIMEQITTKRLKVASMIIYLILDDEFETSFSTI